MKALSFIWKNIHWLVIVLCIAVWVIFKHKPVGPLLSGAALVGFVWSAYAFVKSLNKKLPVNPDGK